MSTTVTKIAFRFPLPSLQGASKVTALDFFTRLIGTPEYVDEWDGGVHGFGYASLAYAKESPEDFRGFLRPVQVGPQWGLEVILGIERDGYGTGAEFLKGILSGKGIDLAPVKEALKEMGVSEALVESGKLYAYTYYNGVDEPLTFE